jgi:hypothetical protein
LYLVSMSRTKLPAAGRRKGCYPRGLAIRLASGNQRSSKCSPAPELTAPPHRSTVGGLEHFSFHGETVSGTNGQNGPKVPSHFWYLTRT